MRTDNVLFIQKYRPDLAHLKIECRFCGNGLDIYHKYRHDQKPEHFIMCESCKACGPVTESGETAIHAWAWNEDEELTDE